MLMILTTTLMTLMLTLTIDDMISDDETANDGPEHPYSLRPNREPSFNYRYDHQFLQCAIAQSSTNQHPLFLHATDFVFTQMSARAGIKKHGQSAVDALIAEYIQLDQKGVFEGIHADTLSPAQKKAALPIVNLIKEKRCGNSRATHVLTADANLPFTVRKKPLRPPFPSTVCCFP
jgi:hypothetical protein